MPTDGFTATDMMLFQKADVSIVRRVVDCASLEFVGRYIQGLGQLTDQFAKSRTAGRRGHCGASKQYVSFLMLRKQGVRNIGAVRYELQVVVVT